MSRTYWGRVLAGSLKFNEDAVIFNPDPSILLLSELEFLKVYNNLLLCLNQQPQVLSPHSLMSLHLQRFPLFRKLGDLATFFQSLSVPTLTQFFRLDKG